MDKKFYFRIKKERQNNLLAQFEWRFSISVAAMGSIFVILGELDALSGETTNFVIPCDKQSTL